MRICSPQLALDADAALGGSVLDRELLTALARVGVKVDLQMVRPPNYDVPETWAVTKLPMTPGFRGARLALQPLILTALMGSIRRNHADAIRVFEASYAGLPALAARAMTGVPVVCHVHHVDDDVPNWQRQIEGVVARRSDAVIALSRFSALQLIDRYRVDASRVHIMPAGVSEHFRPGPREATTVAARLQATDRVILTVSVLRRRKNLAALVRSFARAFLPDNDFVLVVVGPEYAGDPGHADELRALARSLGVGDRVRLVGHVSEEEKLALYRRADLYASTSKREGFGLAVAEALACGIPVVAMEGGAIAELLHSGSGTVVPDGDEESMALALRTMTRFSSIDRARASEVARRVGASYSWLTAARAFADIVAGLN